MLARILSRRRPARQRPAGYCSAVPNTCSSWRSVRWCSALIAPSLRPMRRPISALVRPSTYLSVNQLLPVGRQLRRRLADAAPQLPQLQLGLRPRHVEAMLNASSSGAVGGRRPRSRYQFASRLWAMLVSHDSTSARAVRPEIRERVHEGARGELLGVRDARRARQHVAVDAIRVGLVEGRERVAVAAVRVCGRPGIPRPWGLCHDDGIRPALLLGTTRRGAPRVDRAAPGGYQSYS